MSVRQLRRLDLRANSLGPTAGAAVIESLPQCRNLQVRRARMKSFEGIRKIGRLFAILIYLFPISVCVAVSYLYLPESCEVVKHVDGMQHLLAMGQRGYVHFPSRSSLPSRLDV